jgi:Phosphatidylinositol-4-phosphate 5-Kinase
VFNPDLCIKEYLSNTFSVIRSSSNINALDIYHSFYTQSNFNSIKNLRTQDGGKSESVIIVTYDKKLVVKTVTKDDKNFLVKVFIGDYLKRILEIGSRLVKIFGIFKISPSEQYFIVMDNILFNIDDALIFDIKGSTANRLIQGIENPKKPPPGVILKDMNFLLYKNKVYLSEHHKSEIVAGLVKDFRLLSSYNLTDYSILLAFSTGAYANNHHSFIDDKGKIVTMGVIDILERYNISKASEKKIKTLFKKESKVSAADPAKYCNRISNFLSKIFE